MGGIMTKIIGPDRVLTGACGKYSAPSGSLLPPGALEGILAAVAGEPDDTGSTEGGQEDDGDHQDLD
jgi:hypothetical protein